MKLHLSFRARLLLLPAVAALGAVCVIAVSVVSARGVGGGLAAIELGFTPSVERSVRLETQLVEVRRALQDAAAASDESAIAAADSLATLFRESVQAGRSNSVIPPGSVDSLASAFDAYHALAKEATVAMIRQDYASPAMSRLGEMAAAYSGLSARLAAGAAEDRAAAAAAFAAARAQQGRATLISALVLLMLVLALAALATWVSVGVLRALSMLRTASRALARGDTNADVAYAERDEIGDVAESFRATIAYMREMAAVADALARGDLTVRAEPRSDADQLSRGMARAATTLESLVSETGTLIDAAQHGELGRRGQAHCYSGAYGELIAGMNRMLDATAEPIREANAVLGRVAAADLTARMTGAYHGEFARLRDDLNGSLATLDDTLEEVAVAATQVAAAAAQISSGSADLAGGVGRQAASLEEVASGLRELAASAGGSAASTREAKSLSARARTSADAGMDSMARLSGAIARIKQSADQTGRIVRTIDEIAFQTNLLALNAAVEAARAGEAGRGFAIVAEEVRSLALRSADAARQTTALIDDAVTSAGEGVSLNEQVSEHLAQIQLQVRGVSDVMGEIAAAVLDQTARVRHIDEAVEGVNLVTQQAAASSEESASSAEQLASQAQHLSTLVGRFTLSSRTEAGPPDTAAWTLREERVPATCA